MAERGDQISRTGEKTGMRIEMGERSGDRKTTLGVCIQDNVGGWRDGMMDRWMIWSICPVEPREAGVGAFYVVRRGSLGAAVHGAGRRPAMERGAKTSNDAEALRGGVRRLDSRRAGCGNLPACDRLWWGAVAAPHVRAERNGQAYSR